MDWGPLPQPGPARASLSSHGAAYDVIVLHSPQDSAALLQGDAEGLGAFVEVGALSWIKKRWHIHT